MKVLGQPWVKISGIPLPRRARSWTKWIWTPSTSVRNCGNALSFSSCARQSKVCYIRAVIPACSFYLIGPASAS
jgi:hypothetical protein